MDNDTKIKITGKLKQFSKTIKHCIIYIETFNEMKYIIGLY